MAHSSCCSRWLLIFTFLCWKPHEVGAVTQKPQGLMRNEETADSRSAPAVSLALSANGQVSADTPSSDKEESAERSAPTEKKKEKEHYCESGEFDKPEPVPSESKGYPVQPKSYWWRLRMQQPCVANSDTPYVWKVFEVSFSTLACAPDGHPQLGILTVNKSWSSEDKGIHSNKQLALDMDDSTFWEGMQDDTAQIWLAVEFTIPAEVRCVKFTQCNCPHSARWATLEYNKAYRVGQWSAVDMEASILWGQTSSLAVKEVDTRHAMKKAADSITGEADKVGKEVSNVGTAITNGWTR